MALLPLQDCHKDLQACLFLVPRMEDKEVRVLLGVFEWQNASHPAFTLTHHSQASVPYQTSLLCFSKFTCICRPRKRDNDSQQGRCGVGSLSKGQNQAPMAVDLKYASDQDHYVDVEGPAVVNNETHRQSFGKLHVVS